MQAWVVILAIAGVLWAVMSDKTDPKSTETYLSPTYYPSPALTRSGLTADDGEPDNEDEDEDGERDCIASNITAGTGPYLLQCEKDGSEIIVRFPNGGFIVVDDDGYHWGRSEYWDISVD